MSNFNSVFLKNLDNIILLVIILFTLLVMFSILELDFNIQKNVKLSETPNRIINVETFASSLCNQHENDHVKLESECNKLDNTGCNSTRCCVWVKSDKEEKCKCGDSDGPHYKGTVTNPLNILNYFFKNKCYPGKEKCD